MKVATINYRRQYSISFALSRQEKCSGAGDNDDACEPAYTWKFSGFLETEAWKPESGHEGRQWMGTHIQTEFRPAIRRALKLCMDRFGEDLKAIYIGGSVAFGEALAGVSDVDWWMFQELEPSESDKSWRREKESMLNERYPVVNGFHLSLSSLDRLREEPIWRFIFRYNSVRLHGTDVISELEKEGIHTPAPSRELAQSRIGWLEKITNATVDGRLSEVEFPLPQNPCLATRKLAKWFVILEGAHLLMADCAFSSFRQRDVLQQLMSLYPQWTCLFTITQRILENPFSAGIPPDTFISHVTPFMRWAIERIRNA